MILLLLVIWVIKIFIGLQVILLIIGINIWINIIISIIILLIPNILATIKVLLLRLINDLLILNILN